MDDFLPGFVLGGLLAGFLCIFAAAHSQDTQVMRAIDCMSSQTTASSIDARGFCSDLLDVNADNKK